MKYPGVKEINAPKGGEAINWTLLTNVPVTDFRTAVEKVAWYTLRWKIEEFFRILKSGCQIEATRLSSADRLMRMFAVKSVIAFKLMYLAKAAISHPEETCSKVLSKEEWQTLYCRENRMSNSPLRPPTIKQAIIWLGSQHLALRVSDRLYRFTFRVYWALVSPGIKVIRWIILRAVKNEAERRTTFELLKITA